MFSQAATGRHSAARFIFLSLFVSNSLGLSLCLGIHSEGESSVRALSFLLFVVAVFCASSLEQGTLSGCSIERASTVSS